MILGKLQEALASIAPQRKALDEVEAQLRSMIAKLQGVELSTVNAPLVAPLSNTHFLSTRNVKRDKIDDMVDILVAEGRPLHVTLIAERLSVKRGKKIERTEIEPGLNRHVTAVKERRIEKVGPSTFGLPEWKHNNEQPTLTQLAS